jgi:glycosyltransferase involved in cell wall biosynthesis
MADLTPQVPAVSVIMPTFNSSGTLRLTLQTVLWQDLADFEVLVVGDGCTDDSESVATSFSDPRVTWTNLPANSGGPSAPRNEGLRRARGHFVAYIGHDDLWFPWHLSGLVRCAVDGPSDFVCSLGALVGPSGPVGAFSLPQNAWSRDVAISPSNWLHRRELTNVVGMWAERLMTAQDRDFAQRVLDSAAVVGLRKELSVLKFPSMLWRMYSLTSQFPQAPYVQAMQRDPEALRLQLLTDLGAQAASRGDKLRTSEWSPRGILRALGRRVVEVYGVSRWPVSRIQYWRWRRGSGLSNEHRQGP